MLCSAPLIMWKLCFKCQCKCSDVSPAEPLMIQERFSRGVVLLVGSQSALSGFVCPAFHALQLHQLLCSQQRCPPGARAYPPQGGSCCLPEPGGPCCIPSLSLGHSRLLELVLYSAGWLQPHAGASLSAPPALSPGCKSCLCAPDTSGLCCDQIQGLIFQKLLFDKAMRFSKEKETAQR